MQAAPAPVHGEIEEENTGPIGKNQKEVCENSYQKVGIIICILPIDRFILIYSDSLVLGRSF